MRCNLSFRDCQETGKKKVKMRFGLVGKERRLEGW
jgi:hypothetical protein